MECLGGQAADSTSDLTSKESPVVISSFTSQLELGCIGRAAPMYCVLCFTDGGNVVGTLNLNFIVGPPHPPTPPQFPCFLPDGDGNYDIRNNAVISTPGPQNYRSQNASLQQSWEMNYQEAAIYLQV